MTVVCGHLVTSKKVPTSRNCRRRRRDDCLESINASTPSHSAIKLGMVSDSDSVGGRMDGGKMLLLIVFIASMAKMNPRFLTSLRNGLLHGWIIRNGVTKSNLKFFEVL